METMTQPVEMQPISKVDALWTIIQAQSKSVQRALAKRLNASIESDSKHKVKMTEQEFYAKIDRSVASSKNAPCYTMNPDESGEDFINRITGSAM